MATALKLRSDIKKLKKGLEAKGVSASLKEKLKSQLKKAEDELESLKKTGKAPKKSSVAGTKVALTALQKLIQRKKYGVYQGAGVDLKKDAGEGALATGRRVSKGLKSNQNGDKSDNKGNVYYEYRPNRLDVKQPKKKQSYPKLEKGGYMAKGGEIEDVNKMKKSLIAKAKSKGIYENFGQKEVRQLEDKYGYTKAVQEFDNWAMNFDSSQMADGGMMAKGGEIIFLKSVGTYFRPSDMTVSPMEDFENEGEITSIKDVDEEWVEKLSAEDNKIIFDKMLSKHFKQSREMADGGEIKNIGYAITEETGIKKNDGIEYGSVSRKDVESVLKKEKNKLLKYKGRFARDSHQNIPLFDEIISDLKNDGWRIVDTRKDKMSDGGMMAKGGEVKYKDVDGIERSINFVKEENRLSYYDDIRERKEIAAFINDSSKIVTPSGSNVFPNPIAKAVIKWSKKNGYKFIQDDKEYADGGMMAMGGLTEHGLKIGDLVESQEGDYITVKNNNKFYVVDLNSGYRTMGIKNGGIMEGNVMSTTHRMSK